MNDLEVRTRLLPGGIVVLSVEGALDAHTYEILEAAVLGLFDEGFSRLVVDLTRLRYITSAGAGVFIGSIGMAQECGGDLVLVRPQPNVEQILELLGLTRIFAIERSVEDAAGRFMRGGVFSRPGRQAI